MRKNCGREKREVVVQRQRLVGKAACSMDASCSISNYKLHCLFLLSYPALLLPIPGETFHICWTGIGVDLFWDVLKCLLLSPPGWGPVWQAVYGRPHTPGCDCNRLPQRGKWGYKGVSFCGYLKHIKETALGGCSAKEKISICFIHCNILTAWDRS